MFKDRDVYAFIARTALILQLVSVFPTICFIVRIQFFGLTIKKLYPGFLLVFILNLFVVAVALVFGIFFLFLTFSSLFIFLILFYFFLFLFIFIFILLKLKAMFYPHIGTILRFVGPVSGIIYIFIFPITIHLINKKQQKGSIGIGYLNIFLIFLGAAALVYQFIP